LSFAGDRVERRLPVDLATRLAGYAAARSADPAHVLLAVFTLAVGRYAGVTDLLVGAVGGDPGDPAATVGAARPRVLRIGLADTPGLDGVLDRVRAELADPAHADAPFGRLVEELATERDLSRRPLCQVAFAALPATTVTFPDARAATRPVGTGTSLYDLSMS